jgi:DNA-binding NarL/FixJ family response regulator
VIFIGAVLDGAAAEGLVLVTGAGFPPQAAVSTTTDNPAPIADRRAAMFTHMILTRVTRIDAECLSRRRAGAQDVIGHAVPPRTLADPASRRMHVFLRRTSAGIVAEAFTQRAARELKAAGGTVRKRSPATNGELTPQEAHIVRLVREDLTNQDIAARLFISPRTVEWHLSKIFSKLGVTSRRQLQR